MPAYSFQERFIPSIKDESKTHTIRALRKGRSRHALPGNRLYLYYGMRTKHCRKIGEAICDAIRPITIDEDGIRLAGLSGTLFKRMSAGARNKFAWSDGFRPDGSTKADPAGAWELMLRFWKAIHELPFNGVVIYWKDFIPAK